MNLEQLLSAATTVSDFFTCLGDVLLIVVNAVLLLLASLGIGSSNAATFAANICAAANDCAGV